MLILRVLWRVKRPNVAAPAQLPLNKSQKAEYETLLEQLNAEEFAKLPKSKLEDNMQTTIPKW